MRHVLACILCLIAFAADAADIGVLPVGLSLSAQQDRQAITVTNRGSEPLVAQVEPVAWTQAEGGDQYTPTRDLLVNPAVFSLPPGGAQIVRVGLRRVPDGSREATYRLFVREVPQPAKIVEGGGSGQQIRVLMELRLPVYVAPSNPAPAQQWRARRKGDGGLVLEVTNVGNVHFVVASLRLRAAGAAADSPPFAAVEANTTVLAGQRRHWDIRNEPGARPADSLLLEVVGDRGTQNVALDLGSD